MKKRGIIKLIVVVVVGILTLSYFRVDIRDLIESETTQANLRYAWNLLQTGFQTYVVEPLDYLLDKYIRK